jgi:hypothetical protein
VNEDSADIISAQDVIETLLLKYPEEPHAFVDLTLTCPVATFAPKLTVIAEVFWPDATVAPEGTSHP